MSTTERQTQPSQLLAESASDGARQPLYLSLAHALRRDIESGRYAVGSLLPTNDVLAQRHGVSRHTVRQALRELKDDGLVWSRAGVGTKVRAKLETPRFFSGINTIAELLQFADTTEMRVMSRREVLADVELATQLRCQPGQAWCELTILRMLPESDQPLSYLHGYVRPEYADSVGSQEVLHQPICSLIEARHGVRIVEVLQEITAANLGPKIAHALNAEEGQAAMRITRTFFDHGGSIVEVSIGYYPGGRYTQQTRFRVHGAEGEGIGND